MLQLRVTGTCGGGAAQGHDRGGGEPHARGMQPIPSPMKVQERFPPSPTLSRFLHAAC